MPNDKKTRREIQQERVAAGLNALINDHKQEIDNLRKRARERNLGHFIEKDKQIYDKTLAPELNQVGKPSTQRNTEEKDRRVIKSETAETGKDYYAEIAKKLSSPEKGSYTVVTGDSVEKFINRLNEKAESEYHRIAGGSGEFDKSRKKFRNEEKELSHYEKQLNNLETLSNDIKTKKEKIESLKIKHQDRQKKANIVTKQIYKVNDLLVDRANSLSVSKSKDNLKSFIQEIRRAHDELEAKGLREATKAVTAELRKETHHDIIEQKDSIKRGYETTRKITDLMRYGEEKDFNPRKAAKEALLIIDREDKYLDTLKKYAEAKNDKSYLDTLKAQQDKLQAQGNILREYANSKDNLHKPIKDAVKSNDRDTLNKLAENGRGHLKSLNTVIADLYQERDIKLESRIAAKEAAATDIINKLNNKSKKRGEDLEKKLEAYAKTADIEFEKREYKNIASSPAADHHITSNRRNTVSDPRNIEENRKEAPPYERSQSLGGTPDEKSPPPAQSAGEAPIVRKTEKPLPLPPKPSEKNIERSPPPLPPRPQSQLNPPRSLNKEGLESAFNSIMEELDREEGRGKKDNIEQSPPPLPPRPKSQLSPPNKSGESKEFGNIPPAPVPPPPPPPRLEEKDNIKQPQENKAEQRLGPSSLSSSASGPTASSGREDLLAQIRKGKQLKHVGIKEGSSSKKHASDSMFKHLSDAIEQRRKGIKGESSKGNNGINDFEQDFGIADADNSESLSPSSSPNGKSPKSGQSRSGGN